MKFPNNFCIYSSSLYLTCTMFLCHFSFHFILLLSFSVLFVGICMHKYFKSALQSRPAKQNVCTWTPYNNCHAHWRKGRAKSMGGGLGVHKHCPHTSNMAFDERFSRKARRSEKARDSLKNARQMRAQMKWRFKQNEISQHAHQHTHTFGLCEFSIIFYNANFAPTKSEGGMVRETPEGGKNITCTYSHGTDC